MDRTTLSSSSFERELQNNSTDDLLSYQTCAKQKVWESAKPCHFNIWNTKSPNRSRITIEA